MDGTSPAREPFVPFQLIDSKATYLAGFSGETERDPAPVRCRSGGFDGSGRTSKSVVGAGGLRQVERGSRVNGEAGGADANLVAIGERRG